MYFNKYRKISFPADWCNILQIKKYSVSKKNEAINQLDIQHEQEAISLNYHLIKRGVFRYVRKWNVSSKKPFIFLITISNFVNRLLSLQVEGKDNECLWIGIYPRFSQRIIAKNSIIYLKYDDKNSMLRIKISTETMIDQVPQNLTFAADVQEYDEFHRQIELLCRTASFAVGIFRLCTCERRVTYKSRSKLFSAFFFLREWAVFGC